MNILDKSTRLSILQCLLEGNSIRSTARIVGVSKNTVIKLLSDCGQACFEYQKDVMKSLDCKNIQVDEIWSFVYSKKKTTKQVEGKGDSWTWVAMCADSKIVPTWYTGDRTSKSADKFIEQLSKCVGPNVNIVSDGLLAYKAAISKHMYSANLGVMSKHYMKEKSQKKLVITKEVCQGEMEYSQISTSYIERQNLNIRMGNRRFTRKTNAFSKKIDNHNHSISLYFYYYNFVRKHKTLKTTPANALGLVEELNLDSVLALTDKRGGRNERRKVYSKDKGTYM